jgi:hypothetical protein
VALVVRVRCSTVSAPRTRSSTLGDCPVGHRYCSLSADGKRRGAPLQRAPRRALAATLVTDAARRPRPPRERRCWRRRCTPGQRNSGFWPATSRRRRRGAKRSGSRARRAGPRGGRRLVEQERYVDRVELAAIMGVSVRTVDRLVRDGVPSETWACARVGSCRAGRPRASWRTGSTGQPRPSSRSAGRTTHRQHRRRRHTRRRSERIEARYR